VRGAARPDRGARGDERAAGRGRVGGAGGAARRTRRLIVLALIVQLGYLAVQIAMFSDDLDRFPRATAPTARSTSPCWASITPTSLLGCLLEAGLLAGWPAG
jgi:hypothetical protein